MYPRILNIQTVIFSKHTDLLKKYPIILKEWVYEIFKT